MNILVDKDGTYFLREEWITAQTVRKIGGNIYFFIACVKVLEVDQSNENRNIKLSLCYKWCIS
jgi:hypothetical protein